MFGSSSTNTFGETTAIDQFLTLITTKGITNNTTPITNNAALNQVGSSTFTGAIAADGGISSTNNVYANNLATSNAIWFGGDVSNADNTDSTYIQKNTILPYQLLNQNVSELALYCGNDGTGTTITLPVSGETSQTDYVTVRAADGVHHAFSTSGNYYCAGVIKALGGIDVTNALIKTTGALNSNSLVIKTTAGVTVATINATGDFTTSGLITATNGIKCNSTGSNSYYVGGNNSSSDATAITNPKVQNGIASGTGDGATLSVFNNAINSWYCTGFVDTCYKTCKTIINHRTGEISTPALKGTNGLQYDTTTEEGILEKIGLI